MKKSHLNLFSCLVIGNLMIIALIYKISFEEWGYYFKLQRIPLDVTNKASKVILLWTARQGGWKSWSGFVGHDQIVSGCDSVMTSECIVTTNKDYINSADAVLFSIQNLKQVTHSKKLTNNLR